MVENRWAGFDITGNKKVTQASSKEEKDAAFQKVVDYAESLGITFKGHRPDTQPMMQENCVVYTLDLLGCRAQGIDTKGTASIEANSEVEELKRQLAEKDKLIKELEEDAWLRRTMRAILND